MVTYYLCPTVSIVGCCGYSGRITDRDHRDACPWRAADGKAQGDRQETSFGRSAWRRVCDLFR